MQTLGDALGGAETWQGLLGELFPRLWLPGQSKQAAWANGTCSQSHLWVAVIREHGVEHGTQVICSLSLCHSRII